MNFADVSHHQSMDVAKYAASGRQILSHKATEGTSFVDNQFRTRWQEMKSHGLSRIAYHFSRAAFDGADEFRHFLSVVNGAGGFGMNDRIMLDVEDPDTPGRARANAVEFVNAAVSHGFTRGLIYTYRDYFDTARMPANIFPSGWRNLIIASYSSVADNQVRIPQGWDRATQVVARQYTDKAVVPGVAGTCDDNRLLRDWRGGTPRMATLDNDDKKWLHDELQLAVQAVLKGGGNSRFDSLPAGEQTAVEVVKGHVMAIHDSVSAIENDVENIVQAVVVDGTP